MFKPLCEWILLKAQRQLKSSTFKMLSDSFMFSDLNSGDYIGQKLRENSFDPKGKGSSTMLDDLVKISDSML